MRRRYTWRKDDEWFPMPQKLATTICCCDCGLAHRIKTKVTATGRVYMAAQRDDPETARLRRDHTFACRPATKKATR